MHVVPEPEPICGYRQRTGRVLWVCVAPRCPHARHVFVSLAEALRRGHAITL